MVSRALSYRRDDVETQSVIPDELRTSFVEKLAAQACSTQTPGGAGIRKLSALAGLSGRQESGGHSFNKLALITWCSALCSQRTPEQGLARSA